MTDYLVFRAVQRGRERAAELPDLDEPEARNAAALRDEGKLRLAGLEAILKDVLKVTSVNVEQTAKVLQERASNLLAEHGKDLRVIPHLCAARTQLAGLDGYAESLRLTGSLLRAYPQALFPLADEDDPTDFWQRDNAVSELVSGDGIRALLGIAGLIDAQQSGRITLGDLIGGLRDDSEVPEVAQARLDAALNEIGADRLQQLLDSLREVAASIADAMNALGTGTVSASRVADGINRAVARLARTPQAGPAGPSPTKDLGASAPVPDDSRVGGFGSLRSREDARRAIQDAIDLIEKLEPGHPSPLLLKRAHRMLGMSFLDIIKDMAPNALSDIERIVGTESSN